MKRLLLFIIPVCFSFIGISQNVIWQNDFSDPSDWVLDNSGQNPPNYGWSIDATSDGWWSSGGITSTSGGNFAELNNGDPIAGTQALNVDYTMTTSNPIDVSGLGLNEQLVLEFQQYGALFHDKQEVMISNDGLNFHHVGDNSDKDILNSSGGSPYSNPDYKQIRISLNDFGVVDNLWIRFQWTTAFPNSSFPEDWVTYGWMIDDVSLVTCSSFPTFSNITSVVCDVYYSPSGKTYDSSGIYQDTIINNHYCDSIITIDLTVNNSYYSVFEDSICDLYSLNGETYYSPGTYTQTYIRSNGCDSIITINLLPYYNIINISSFSEPELITNYTDTAHVLALGGAPPYIYNWSNGSSDSMIIDVFGMYDFTVSDQNGCVASDSIEISFLVDSANFQIPSTCTPNPSVSAGTDTTFYPGSKFLNSTDTVVLNCGVLDQYYEQVIEFKGLSSPTFYDPSTGITANIDSIVFNGITGLPSGLTFQANNGGSWDYNSTGCITIFGIPNSTFNSCINPIELNFSFCYSTTIFGNPINSCANQNILGYQIPIASKPSYEKIDACSIHLWGVNGNTYDSTGIYTYIGNNCDTINVLDLKITDIPTDPICIVTVDSTSTKNKIVWNKILSNSILSYNVYRELGTNNYVQIGNVPYDSLSQFVDTTNGINPNVTSYRYKISVIDSCNIERELSDFHETIHLTSNLGANGEINLSWDPYEGFPFSFYRILRDSTFSGNFEVLDSVSANNTTYTDFFPPLVGGNYLVEVLAPYNCSPTKTAINSSRSNTGTISTGGSAPTSDFSSTSTQITAGTSIDFLDQSINNPTTWSWDFYGANPSTSNSQNPTNITYNNIGLYDVRLIVSNANGIDTLVKTNYIEVISSGGVAPTSGFIASDTQIQEGNSIDFLDQSQNNPTSWTWLFDGGSPSFSTNQSPTGVLYNTSGIYDVTLITSNSFGVDTLVKSAYINVSSSTSINDNEESKLTVHPNPTQDQITIDIKGYNGVVNVEVYDLQGRLLETTTNTIVSLKKHAKGIYVLKVSYGEITEEVRVVRE